MQNPIRAFREAVGLGRVELAAVAGVSYATVYESEAGFPLRVHPSLADALLRLGYEGDPAAEYQRWRQERAGEVARRLEAAKAQA